MSNAAVTSRTRLVAIRWPLELIGQAEALAAELRSIGERATATSVLIAAVRSGLTTEWNEYQRLADSRKDAA